MINNKFKMVVTSGRAGRGWEGKYHNTGSRVIANVLIPGQAVG